MKSPGLAFPKRRMSATAGGWQAELALLGGSCEAARQAKTKTEKMSTLGVTLEGLLEVGSAHESCVGPLPTGATPGQGGR